MSQRFAITLYGMDNKITRKLKARVHEDIDVEEVSKEILRELEECLPRLIKEVIGKEK